MLLIGIAPQFSYLKSGVTEAWEQGEFEEDSQKVQASGYEISKYWGCGVGGATGVQKGSLGPKESKTSSP